MKAIVNFKEVANIKLNSEFVNASQELVDYCANNSILEIVKEAKKGDVEVKAVKILVDGDFICGVLVRNNEIAQTPSGKYLDLTNFNKLLSIF